jgi:hypothetical protein
MADWHRVQNIGMINTKVSTLNALGMSESDDDYTYGFTNVTLPTVQLNFTHLGQMYDQLARLGAQEFAVGMSDGAPVYSLNIGPGQKRALFQTNDFVRTAVNYMDMGKEFNENFLPRGIQSAVNGFIPNVDPFPVRYTANLTPIYPFINRAVTQGTQGWKNPAYRTPAVDPINGTAVYEAFSVMARMIYSRRPRPVGPIQISQQSFNAVTYGGEVRWINNPDMANNQLGNFGFYRVDIQQAAMPEYPELGFTGLTLAVD